jgi:hypothetical protein
MGDEFEARHAGALAGAARLQQLEHHDETMDLGQHYMAAVRH